MDTTTKPTFFCTPCLKTLTTVFYISSSRNIAALGKLTLTKQYLGTVSACDPDSPENRPPLTFTYQTPVTAQINSSCVVYFDKSSKNSRRLTKNVHMKIMCILKLTYVIDTS